MDEISSLNKSARTDCGLFIFSSFSERKTRPPQALWTERVHDRNINPAEVISEKWRPVRGSAKPWRGKMRLLFLWRRKFFSFFSWSDIGAVCEKKRPAAENRCPDYEGIVKPLLNHWLIPQGSIISAYRRKFWMGYPGILEPDRDEVLSSNSIGNIY